MTKQSLVSGLISGLILSIGLLYPALSLVVLRENADLFGAAAAADRTQAVGLVIAGVICTIGVLLIGIYPALRTNAMRWSEGARTGLYSGVIAAMVVFIVVVIPTNAWQASVPLLGYSANLADPLPPDDVIATFVQRVLVYAFVRLLPIALMAGAAIGWLEGGLIGAARRNLRLARPLALIDVIDDRRGQRRWIEHHDETGRAGWIAGILCGALIIVASLNTTTDELAVQAPRLGNIIRTALSSLPGAPQALNSNLASLLSPLVAAALVGYGALACVLLRDPARRFASRIGAASIAGGLVGVAIFFDILRALIIAIGLARFPSYGLISWSTYANIEHWIQPPIVTAAAFFLIPFGLVLAVVGLMMTAGAAQGLLYGLILMAVVRRPVDKAATYNGRLRDDPARVLPQLYTLFNQQRDAAAILPHLAFYARRRQPETAHVIAAHHLALTQPERAAEALPIVSAALDARPEWLWQPEIGALYRVFNAGLQARTLEQVADIEPLPEKQTSTLPPMLSKASEAVTRVLNELRKVERVDEVNSKIIFLNNALDAIRAGQRHAAAMREGHLPIQNDWISIGDVWRNDAQLKAANTRFQAIKGPEDILPALSELGKVNWGHNLEVTIRRAGELGRHAERQRNFYTATAYPETAPLRAMLDHWQELVMSAVKDLQGRAALVASIKTRQLTYAAEVPVTITVKNEGLNIAESVRFKLLDSENYRAIEGGEQTLDLIVAGSQRDIDLTIEPRTADRVRLQWQLIYDDAVDDDRQMDFGDLIEFERAEAQRPFVRIFPIPYVTGMPLKTEHLFVGRDDVFAYIKEHLFGAYQNNVIVLHGQRRTGKTSILYRLKKVLTDTHVCVLIDMQGKAARGTLDFLYSLADDIVYELEDHDLAVELPPRSDFAESPEFVFRSRFLRGVYDKLPANSTGAKKHLLLMFDEFEELQKRVQDGKLEPEIFPFLRNLMQHEDNLDFVFAGTHKLEELGAEYWSILFNIASYKKITFLTHDDAQRLIAEPVAPHIEYDPIAIERIIDVTGGHPYFTQVICHELVAYHNETQRSYLTATDVEEVLDRIVERGEAHFKFIWAESGPIEHAVLLALADLLETDDTASVDEVQALLDKRAINLNSTPLTQTLDGLEMGDILTRSGPRSNLYRFKIDLIRRWIYATRPS